MRGGNMAGNCNQKMKLLFIMKMLCEQTDENHTLSINDIIAQLEMHEISAERKSIYSDIEVLKQFGLDVISRRSKNCGYYIAGREFELPELKLLVDVVQSAKFITHKKSKELIKKLEALTSKHMAKELQRHVFIVDRVKTFNEKIYYNIDALTQAIQEKKQVSFKYYEYTIEKKKQYRNESADYEVSPYELAWTEDNYYLLAYYEKHDGLTHFRVDRMCDIKVLHENIISLKQVTGKDNFNVAEYTKGIFNMYSGEMQSVQLLFCNSLINVVIDRFGEDVSIYKGDDTHFVARVNVNASQTFLAWLFQFGDKVKIMSPQGLQEKMKEMTQKVGELY
jgi:predicted DNA-binding transcriptional regulator YafY